MQALGLPPFMLIAVLIGGALFAVANFILYNWILPEVNNRLTNDLKVTPFGLNFRMIEVLGRHHDIAPRSRKRTAMYILLAVGFFIGVSGILVGILSLPIRHS